MTTAQALTSIAIIAFFTFLTRAIPFLIFPKDKSIPKYIKYLGDVLPFAVIGMLIVYCLKTVSILTFPYGLPEGIAVIFVIIVHKWKHNLLFSVLGGTILYMVLVQTIFNMSF